MKPKLLFTVIAALGLAACERSPMEPIGAVASVSIAPTDVTLIVGESRQMHATVRAANGAIIDNTPVTWQSTDSTVALMSATGLVTAVQSGTIRVRALAGGQTGETWVVVATPNVVSVDIDRATLQLLEGDEVQLTAIPRDAQGTAIPGLGIQWSTSGQDIASVGALGRVTAVRHGSATITATVHGVSVSVPVTVTAGHSFDLLYTVRTGQDVELFRLGLGAGANDPQQLVSLEPMGEHPRLSPDGSRVAFQCMSNFGDRSLCVANRDGSNRVLVAWGLGEWFGQPTWNRDGTRLAFFHEQYEGAAVPARRRIGVVNADGTDLEILTADMPDDQHEPAWSPVLIDGTERIAFTSGTNTARNIWTMRADGSDRRQLTAATGVFEAAPDWSPDGHTLAFQRIGVTGFDLRLVGVNGVNDRSLGSALPGNQVTPSWSPDGRLIAFRSNHETLATSEPTYQIYTVWADGSKLARRTWDTVDKLSPAWLRH